MHERALELAKWDKHRRVEDLADDVHDGGEVRCGAGRERTEVGGDVRRRRVQVSLNS